MKVYVRNIPQLAGYLILITGLFLLTMSFLNANKKLPGGISFQGKDHPADRVEFLADITYTDNDGQRIVEQEIFDSVLDMINEARRLILIDMFLFNDFKGRDIKNGRPLSDELTTALVKRKQLFPAIEITMLTDPINSVYGSLPSPYYERLQSVGIQVVETDIDLLRDSNVLYSSFWRVLVQPFDNGPGNLLPNPFGRGSISLRSFFKLLNFKANHRKTIITDSSRGFEALVTSANPHDASSAHVNSAIRFSGPAVADLFETEKAVLSFSGGQLPGTAVIPSSTPAQTSVTVITEEKIKKAVLQAINQTGPGDNIDLVMFYLSDREIVTALKTAFRRGVSLRVLLDPNKDAFGRRKNGIPNRPVGHELEREGIPVRWYDTHGEQCHAKMILVRHKDGTALIILGSANFTRRNLNNLNLETDVLVKGPSDSPVFGKAHENFQLIWNNTPDKHFSVGYNEYKDTSLFKRVGYRFMEATGLCTF